MVTTILLAYNDNCIFDRDSGSSTESTDEDERVGGLGMFSHGRLSLTHQHWVSQVITAGGFNVHCTQGPEASHKINMHLAAARVRHGGQANITQFSMLHYLCNYIMYEDMIVNGQDRPAQTAVIQHKSCVKVPIESPVPQGRGFQRDSARYRACFIHRQVRVAVNEFYDLLCPHLGLKKTIAETYEKLASLSFTFGQLFVRADGQKFWATDCQYTHGKGRRDMLRLKGRDSRGDAFTCETVCFVEVSGVTAVCPTRADHLILVLVRWLEPHPGALSRDAQGRPLCPGPLHINNCLWRYARTKRPRGCFVAHGKPQNCSRTFSAHSEMFGTTRAEQDLCWEREKFAWYDLVYPDNIVGNVNLCRTFKPNTSEPVHDTWLETLNL